MVCMYDTDMLLSYSPMVVFPSMVLSHDDPIVVFPIQFIRLLFLHYTPPVCYPIMIVLLYNITVFHYRCF